MSNSIAAKCTHLVNGRLVLKVLNDVKHLCDGKANLILQYVSNSFGFDGLRNTSNADQHGGRIFHAICVACVDARTLETSQRLNLGNAFTAMPRHNAGGQSMSTMSNSTAVNTPG